MPLLSTGISTLNDRGLKPTPTTGPFTRFGIGNGKTPFAKTQTALTGSSILIKDAAVEVTNGGTSKFTVTIGPSEGNFEWNEWAVYNANPRVDKTCLNRVVQVMGTKVQGQTWTIVAKIQLEA